MSDRAARLRTLATSFYRELMRLADEMDAGKEDLLGDLLAMQDIERDNPTCTCQNFPGESQDENDLPCQVHGIMDPALDC